MLRGAYASCCLDLYYCLRCLKINIVIVVNKKELRLFAEKQSFILQNSYIDADFSRIPDSELTKKLLLHIIQRKIESLVLSLPDKTMNSNFDYLNVIYDVKYRGKEFVYSYVRDLPIFKDSSFDHIENSHGNCFLIVLKNGDVYHVNTEYGDLLYSKWENCPNRYYPKDLLERILRIIQPLLDYEYDAEDREFAISAIKSCFPFNNHENASVMLQEVENRTMEYWEYRIKNYPHLYLDRGTVFCIKKYTLRSLDGFEISPEWDSLFEKVKVDISLL